MSLINCTPHALTIVGGPANIVLPPSGIVPRCGVQRTAMPDTEGIPTVRTVLAAVVVGLPDTQEGVYLIVSALVMGACPNRADLRSPGEAVRNDAGVIVGCRGLCC